jgi:DNA-binding NarL/FixJ family response regulator
MASLRVLVAGDDTQVIGDAATLLRSQAGVEVLGPISVSALAPGTASSAGADVIVLVAGPDHKHTLDVLRDLDDGGAAVLVLSPPGLDVPGALGAGGRGMLARGTEVEVLDAAVRAVAGGLVVVDPSLWEFGRPSIEQGGLPPVEELTARETEVLQSVAAGLSNKEIARRLGVSEHTVKFHVDAILGKLGAHTRTEAATRAARLGLITL